MALRRQMGWLLGGLLAAASGCGEDPGALSAFHVPGLPDPALAQTTPADSARLAAEPPTGLGVEEIPSAHPPPPAPPIILVHGFTGFSDLVGIEYFYEVREDLIARGETHVFAPSLPPYNSAASRAHVLADYIDQVLAETGAEHVHLVAHSQGGIDSRAVISSLGYADKVRSLVTIATPHRGTTLADLASDAPAGVLNPAGQALAWAIGALDDPPNETQVEDGANQEHWEPALDAAITQLSSDGMAAFNEQNPDRPSVPIFSVAAYSNLRSAPGFCDDALWRPGSGRDAIDALLLGSAVILNGTNLLDPRHNDGLVPTDSMPWGTLLGCVPADHLDEIGQIADSGAAWISGFDHKDLYRDVVAHLRTLD